MPLTRMMQTKRAALALGVVGTLGLFFILVALRVNAQDGLPLYALPDATRYDPVMSNSIVLANDAQTVATVNMLSNSVTLSRPALGELLFEVPVGADPRSVAITPNGSRILTANRGDHTLSIVGRNEQAVLATVELGGLSPYGVIAASDSLAYVSLQNSDEIVAVDLNSAQVIQRIAVPDSPTGLALWGDFLYVTHFWSGDVSLIYLPQGRVVTVADTGLDTGISQSITIDEDRGVAYLPQTRLNAQNINLTYDSTVFPVVNVLDLSDLRIRQQERITLDTADRPVNMPFTAVLDPRRDVIYIANAGSNDISAINLTTRIAIGHVEVGANPRGLLINRDGTLLYAHNALDATLTVISTVNFEVVDVLPISNPTIPTDILIGAQLFHDADDPRLASNGWISCATCHFDGESDGRVWMGFPGGPRNTPLLYELPETAPYLWTGQWDELADVELRIRDVQAGEGLIEGDVNPPMGDPHSGLSPDLDTLVAYLLSRPAPGTLAPTDTALVERGREVFAAQGCGECHVGQVGTNLAQYDVGTARLPLEREGTAFDTPSLRWLWLSAPYFHDGAATTLREVFELPGEHQLLYDVPPEDIDALVEYLLAWPSANIP